MEIQNLRSPLLDRWQNDQLRYSNVWEDQACLTRAAQTLARMPKQILSIASAGDNALSLLELDPERLVVLDLSPSQTALTELKWRALAHLTFTDFLTLLGYSGEPSEREGIYDMIRPVLSDGARGHWDGNLQSLNEGILHQGRLDGYFQKFREAVIPRIWKPAVFLEMTETQDPARQMQCWMNGDMDLLKMAVGEFFSKSALSREGRHASQFAYVRQEDTGPIFLKNFRRLISTQLISRNPYLYFFMTGRPLLGEYALPLLNENRFNELKSRAGRVEIMCSDLEGYLSTQSSNFDFMNLSDIFEYLSEEEAAGLFSALGSRVNPGGALAYWTLLVDRRPTAGLKINEALSTEISAADRTWFYSNFYFAERLSE